MGCNGGEGSRSDRESQVGGLAKPGGGSVTPCCKGLLPAQNFLVNPSESPCPCPGTTPDRAGREGRVARSKVWEGGLGRNGGSSPSPRFRVPQPQGLLKAMLAM